MRHWFALSLQLANFSFVPFWSSPKPENFYWWCSTSADVDDAMTFVYLISVCFCFDFGRNIFLHFAREWASERAQCYLFRQFIIRSFCYFCPFSFVAIVILVTVSIFFRTQHITHCMYSLLFSYKQTDFPVYESTRTPNKAKRVYCCVCIWVNIVRDSTNYAVIVFQAKNNEQRAKQNS